MEALLTLALTTGMRRGELLALRWGDIDFEKGVLYVQRTMSKVAGRGYYERQPKTRASRRKIVLSNVAIEALKEHRLRQEKERREMGDEWCERDIVFCNRSGGFSDPDRVGPKLRVLLKKVGLPTIRFHDLRHSAATILLGKGVHPKVIAELLGHSKVTMTLDTYSHVLPSMLQEAVDKMDDVFEYTRD
jgi:integrase